MGCRKRKWWNNTEKGFVDVDFGGSKATDNGSSSSSSSSTTEKPETEAIDVLSESAEPLESSMHQFSSLSDEEIRKEKALLKAKSQALASASAAPANRQRNGMSLKEYLAAKKAGTLA